MKGQMFILTIVFLVGLIFSVQSLLLSYSYIDLSQGPQTSDSNIIMVISEAIRETIETTDFCSDAQGNLNELNTHIVTGMLSLYDIDISYSINCGRWDNPYPDPPPVEADVRIVGEATDTEAGLVFYHNITG